MHLLYCDESNLEERAGDFLLYAGLSVPPERAGALSGAIEAIRLRHAIPHSFQLKFNPGPKHLAHEKFVLVKQAILEAAAAHGVQLFAYAILHDIARSADEARRNGINTVCYHFDCFLNRVAGKGIVLIDRFNDAGNRIDDHTRDKFAIGLTGMPYSATMRLKNILGVHYATIGQSHFCSLADIAVGSLRFAINAHTRGRADQISTARALLALLGPLFFREEGRDAIPEIGFQFSPKAVRSKKHRERYADLRDFLVDCGARIEQAITDERTY